MREHIQTTSATIGMITQEHTRTEMELAIFLIVDYRIAEAEGSCLFWGGVEIKIITHEIKIITHQWNRGRNTFMMVKGKGGNKILLFICSIKGGFQRCILRNTFWCTSNMSFPFLRIRKESRIILFLHVENGNCEPNNGIFQEQRSQVSYMQWK